MNKEKKCNKIESKKYCVIMWNIKLNIEKMNIQNVKMTLPSIVMMVGTMLGVPFLAMKN